MNKLLIILLMAGIATIGDSQSLSTASAAKAAKPKPQAELPGSRRNGESSLVARKIKTAVRFDGTDSNFHSPTYLQDVVPIVMGKCYRCHNQQTIFLNNWLDYHKAYADRWELRRRIWDSWKGHYFKQSMPIANSPESEAITEEERALIKRWVEGGAVYGVPPKASNPRSKAERMEIGKRLFTTICAACHQPSGQGIPNRFPPLAGSDFLNSDKQRAIEVLLNGLQGEVVVNGSKFNNAMPMFPFSDGDIASALTYVFGSFGNSGQDVTPEEVTALRGRTDKLPNAGTRVNAAQPAQPSPWE